MQDRPPVRRGLGGPQIGEAPGLLRMLGRQPPRGGLFGLTGPQIRGLLRVLGRPWVPWVLPPGRRVLGVHVRAVPLPVVWPLGCACVLVRGPLQQRQSFGV